MKNNMRRKTLRTEIVSFIVKNFVTLHTGPRNSCVCRPRGSPSCFLTSLDDWSSRWADKLTSEKLKNSMKTQHVSLIDISDQRFLLDAIAKKLKDLEKQIHELLWHFSKIIGLNVRWFTGSLNRTTSYWKNIFWSSWNIFKIWEIFEDFSSVLWKRALLSHQIVSRK